MSSLDKLVKLFERFPGIGARQARRFAHHILTEPHAERAELARLIETIDTTVAACEVCFRFFTPYRDERACGICSDASRDTSRLMVVERDTDIQAIERSGVYDGYYFVLGGTVPLLNSEETKKLRGGALKHAVEIKAADHSLTEIILAFSVNPDGENTARYVESLLKDILSVTDIQISQLGRGLSTGSELEYADPETIKNALKNRG